MRWEDESYVKLYTRDTPTWKAMNWQARCVWPLLMRKLDKAGLMECGELGRSAVALMVELPDEVVIPGLERLEKLGVITWHGTTLEAPKFEEAQEAKKTELLKKRDQRQRARDVARAQAMREASSQPPENIQGVSPGVPQCPKVSPDVPLQTPQTPQPRHPSPAEAAPPAKKPEPARVEEHPPPPDVEWFVWSQGAAEVAVPGRFPEHPPPEYREWYPRATKAVGSPERLAAAWLSWLKDPWAASRRPAFTIKAFIGQNKWREFVPPEVAHESA